MGAQWVRECIGEGMCLRKLERFYGHSVILDVRRGCQDCNPGHETCSTTLIVSSQFRNTVRHCTVL